MIFVSITRLRVRSLLFMPGFYLHAMGTSRQVKQAEGYIDGALLADRKNTFWTLTLWQDQAAMRRYITNGAHLKVMPKLMEWCDEASIVHWLQESTIAPDWAEADRRMRSEGRPSKVRHPSLDHVGQTYAPPRVKGGVSLKPTSVAQ